VTDSKIATFATAYPQSTKGRHLGGRTVTCQPNESKHVSDWERWIVGTYPACKVQPDAAGDEGLHRRQDGHPLVRRRCARLRTRHGSRQPRHVPR
jgi:hypothetical protein